MRRVLTLFASLAERCQRRPLALQAAPRSMALLPGGTPQVRALARLHRRAWHASSVSDLPVRHPGLNVSTANPSRRYTAASSRS